MTPRTGAVCLLTLTWAVSGARPRVPVRPLPQPDRTLHVTTTQQLAISLNAGEEGGPAGPQIVSRSLLTYTQTNGRFDQQNRLPSQLTIERLEAEETLNGTRRAPGDPAALAGRSLTMVFDRDGKLIEITVPKESERMAGTLKYLVSGAHAAVNFLPAAVTMAVGETAAFPSDIPLKLPQAAAAAPYPTITTMTLRAIEGSGPERIARFAQRIESAGDTGQLKVQGSGSVDVNLARGFVSASSTEWTFTGTQPGVGAAGRPGQVRATVKITVIASEPGG